MNHKYLLLYVMGIITLNAMNHDKKNNLSQNLTKSSEIHSINTRPESINLNDPEQLKKVLSATAKEPHIQERVIKNIVTIMQEVKKHLDNATLIQPDKVTCIEEGKLYAHHFMINQRPIKIISENAENDNVKDILHYFGALGSILKTINVDKDVIYIHESIKPEFEELCKNFSAKEQSENITNSNLLTYSPLNSSLSTPQPSKNSFFSKKNCFNYTAYLFAIYGIGVMGHKIWQHI